MELELGTIIKLVLGLVAVVVVLGLLRGAIVIATPGLAAVIYGTSNEPRILVGKLGFKIPIFDQVDKLPISSISIDVTSDGYIKTADFIDVSVDANANVRIDIDDQATSQIAIKNFAGKSIDFIRAEAQQILQANMRETVGQMGVVEISKQKDLFAQKIRENAVDDLANIGLIVDNFNIQTFQDKQGILENIGKNNQSEIEKVANIARAKADSDVAIAQAEASEKTNIIENETKSRNNKRDFDLNMEAAELERAQNIAKADADTSYEIRKQTNRKMLETETANAEIEKATLSEQYETRVASANKAKLEGSVKANAEADAFRKKQEADARAYETVTQAKANKELAESTKAIGLAEAEVLQKKAEAQNTLNEQALSQQLVALLPEIFASISEPLSNVDSITMYGSGNVSELMGEQVKSVDAIFSGLKDSIGLDLTEVITGKVKADQLGKALKTDVVENAKYEFVE